jgi:predicted NBD/HSP70 family sugar kinase
LNYFVGVDVGGTTSTVALGNTQKEVVHVSEQFATMAQAGPAATVNAIVQQIIGGIAILGAEASNIVGVAIATPGPATLDGVLLKSPNLNPELWNRFPIRGELQNALQRHGVDVEVKYLGDGQAAALGEFATRAGMIRWSRYAQGKPQTNLNSLFMAVVGTGLGGGEVRDRQMVRGREGRAGHVGHIFLPEYAFRYEHDRKLVVGNATCTMESAVSLTGLTHQLEYRLSLDAWKNHSLHTVPGTIRDKAKMLRKYADAGDDLALQLFDDQARALGIGMLSVNYLGDYDLLVIGGGVCDLSPSVRDRYRKIAEDAYRECALDGFRNLSGFEFSACGDEAPVIGALAQAYT